MRPHPRANAFCSADRSSGPRRFDAQRRVPASIWEGRCASRAAREHTASPRIAGAGVVDGVWSSRVVSRGCPCILRPRLGRAGVDGARVRRRGGRRRKRVRAAGKSRVRVRRRESTLEGEADAYRAIVIAKAVRAERSGAARACLERSHQRREQRDGGESEPESLACHGILCVRGWERRRRSSRRRWAVSVRRRHRGCKPA